MGKTRLGVLGAALAVIFTPLDADGNWRSQHNAGRCVCQPPIACPPIHGGGVVCLSGSPRLVPHSQSLAGPSLVWPRGKLQRAEAFSEHAIKVCDRLRPYSNYADLGTYLLPIKKAAARALAMARAGSDDDGLAAAMVQLHQAIVNADRYIDDMLERDAAFWTVIELLIVKAGIAKEASGGR